MLIKAIDWDHSHHCFISWQLQTQGTLSHCGKRESNVLSNGLCKCYFDSGTGAKEKNKRQQFIIRRKKNKNNTESICWKCYVRVNKVCLNYSKCIYSESRAQMREIGKLHSSECKERSVVLDTMEAELSLINFSNV